MYQKMLRKKHVLKPHIKHCFKINDKQGIIIPEQGEYVHSKNYERKKSLFIVYADFESILVPENNRKQNLEQYNTNKLLAKTILLAVMAIN